MKQYNPAFEKAVTDNFKDIISDYSFEMHYDRNRTPDEIQLLNDRCIIRFILDMGLIGCSFVDPVEKRQKENMPKVGLGPAGFTVYLAIPLWKFLYPNDNINYSYGWVEIEKQVVAIKKLLLERLTNVMNGDFSWAEDYVVKNMRLSKKIEYMMNHWETDNPVRVKFRNGDPAWEKDFDEYKHFLDTITGK